MMHSDRQEDPNTKEEPDIESGHLKINRAQLMHLGQQIIRLDEILTKEERPNSLHFFSGEHSRMKIEAIKAAIMFLNDVEEIATCIGILNDALSGQDS